MSHNLIDSYEVEKINEGLSENHSILGLHFGGNEGEVDALGFIQPHSHNGYKEDPNYAGKLIKDIENVGRYSIFTRIRPDLNQGVIDNPVAVGLKANSNCWMCEGWSEYSFEFIPKEHVDIVVEAVKLNLSTNEFEGQILGIDSDKSMSYNLRNVSSKDPRDQKQVFATMRMLPPGKVYYYYSV